MKINKQFVLHAPLNIKSRRDLFVNYKLLGTLLQHMGDLKESFRMLQKQLLIAKKLDTLDPLDSQWQKELGLSYCRIGLWFESQGEWTDSLEMFQKCLVIFTNLALQDPINSDRQHDLGVVYNRIGTVLEAKGDLSDALSMHQKALIIVDQLSAKDPINLWLMHELCVAYDRAEGVLVTQGDLTNALEMRLKNLSISEHLALQVPLNADLQRDLAFSLYKTGEIYEKLNQLVESVSLWRRELDIHVALFRHGENFIENKLACCCNRIGTALVAIDELIEARFVQSEYQRHSESVLAQDPEDLTKQWNLVLGQVNLARTELLLGNHEVAITLYIKANQAFDFLNSCENK